MSVDQLRSIFPDEASCRVFFESVIWPDGPACPHCQGRSGQDRTDYRSFPHPMSPW
jgi:hypothetical protein